MVASDGLKVRKGEDFGSALVSLRVEPDLSHERPDHPPPLVNRPLLHHFRKRTQHARHLADGLIEVHLRTGCPFKCLDPGVHLQQLLLEFGNPFVGELAVVPRDVVEDVVDLGPYLLALGA